MQLRLRRDIDLIIAGNPKPQRIGHPALKKVSEPLFLVKQIYVQHDLPSKPLLRFLAALEDVLKA